MSTTTLKIIALIFMLIDHIGEFIPLAPTWFRWIGRMSAPLFFFCMAWGFFYTRDKKIYLIRMYLCGVGMALMNVIVSNFNIKHYYVSILNDIFVTLFTACFIIFIIDTFHTNSIKGKKYLLLFSIIQTFSTVLLCVIDYYGLISCNVPIEIIYQFYGAIFGNVFLAEGNVPFILLGVLLYYTKNNKKKLVASYSCFCIIYSILYGTNFVACILERLESVVPESFYKIIVVIPSLLDMQILPIYNARSFSFINCYWMAIFSLPFMLLYNGKKGRGFKYFFYLFYPLHIYILYFIGNFIF